MEWHEEAVRFPCLPSSTVTGRIPHISNRKVSLFQRSANESTASACKTDGGFQPVMPASTSLPTSSVKYLRRPLSFSTGLSASAATEVCASARGRKEALLWERAGWREFNLPRKRDVTLYAFEVRRNPCARRCICFLSRVVA
jgi:hypothetical protein